MTETVQQEQKKDAQCTRCEKRLLSSLTSASSKTRHLFNAMGVDIASFQTIQNGVQIHVPSNSKMTHSQTNKQGFGGSQIDDPEQAKRPQEVKGRDTKTLQTNTKESVMGKLRNRLTKRFTKPATDEHISISSNTNSSKSPTHKKGIDLQISCQKCGDVGPESGARAFVKGPEPLSIVLCQNRLSTQEEINEVLVHELMHVYDVHYRGWDLTNCYTLAKSEIRAAREAECSDSSIKFMKRFCVKEKAKVATKNMFNDVGLQCVNTVFEDAMKDVEPFQQKQNDIDMNIDGRSFQSTFPSDNV